MRRWSVRAAGAADGTDFCWRDRQDGGGHKEVEGLATCRVEGMGLAYSQGSGFVESEVCNQVSRK